MTTMLDFYQQHAISPVTQVLPDIDAHFQRRAHLYRSLGLWPRSIEGKSVLEVGPGSGQNALYTASLKPSVYALLEPNPVGLAELSECLIEYRNPISIGQHVICRRIEEFTAHEPFDVVLCEGLLGLCGGDPLVLLEHLVKHVKLGGVLVITCIDAISDHAEVLRRALAQRYITPSMSLAEKVDALRPVFTPHLATLKGMTRSVDDWIVDNLLNPASIGPTFSIPDALTHLEGRFEVLGCSPRFLMDWRWYKQAEPGNAWAIEAYWRNAHNLCDYRQMKPALENSVWNHKLMTVCLQVRADVAALERGEPVSVNTRAVERDPGWFGRGQQYLSLVRV